MGISTCGSLATPHRSGRPVDDAHARRGQFHRLVGQLRRGSTADAVRHAERAPHLLTAVVAHVTTATVRAVALGDGQLRRDPGRVHVRGHREGAGGTVADVGRCWAGRTDTQSGRPVQGCQDCEYAGDGGDFCMRHL